MKSLEKALIVSTILGSLASGCSREDAQTSTSPIPTKTSIKGTVTGEAFDPTSYGLLASYSFTLRREDNSEFQTFYMQDTRDSRNALISNSLVDVGDYIQVEFEGDPHNPQSVTFPNIKLISKAQPSQQNQ